MYYTPKCGAVPCYMLLSNAKVKMVMFKEDHLKDTELTLSLGILRSILILRARLAFFSNSGFVELFLLNYAPQF